MPDISLEAPSTTVNELVEVISIVLLSFLATGASLIPVTVIFKVAVSVPPFPSETV